MAPGPPEPHAEPGRVLEASAIGFVLILLAVVSGQWVALSPDWAPVFTLTGPALATVGIFTFQGAWNDFLWPLLVGQRKALWTLQVALAQLRSGLASGVIQWSEILAGTVIATLPIMIVFLLAQRYFVRGIALTGIK